MDKYILYFRTASGFHGEGLSFDSIEQYEDYLKSPGFAISVRDLGVCYTELRYSTSRETVPTTQREIGVL